MAKHFHFWTTEVNTFSQNCSLIYRQALKFFLSQNCNTQDRLNFSLLGWHFLGPFTENLSSSVTYKMRENSIFCCFLRWPLHTGFAYIYFLKNNRPMLKDRLQYAIMHTFVSSWSCLHGTFQGYFAIVEAIILFNYNPLLPCCKASFVI